MRNLYKLLLLAAAAMAIAAPNAGATSGVEVMDEISEDHCGEVIVTGHEASGGCVLFVASEGGAGTPSTQLISHTGISEATISICSLQFTARVNEEGHGYITSQQMSGASCGITACDEPPTDHEHHTWEIQLTELFANHAALGLTFCIRPSSVQEGSNLLPPCSVVIDVSEPQQHDYEFTANGVPCLENPTLELRGHWTLSFTSIEINHL